MLMRIWSSPWGRLAVGAAILTGCCVAAAHAGFPHPGSLPPPPPFPVPPPHGVSETPPPVQPPPVTPHGPPPIHGAPEPGTLTIGLIGAGVAGFVARRKRRQGEAAAQ